MDLNKHSRRKKINIPTEIANITQQVTPAVRIQVAPTDLHNLPDRKSYDIFNLIIPGGGTLAAKSLGSGVSEITSEGERTLK